jgi:hypothetical protein
VVASLKTVRSFGLAKDRRSLPARFVYVKARARHIVDETEVHDVLAAKATGSAGSPSGSVSTNTEKTRPPAQAGASLGPKACEDDVSRGKLM